jgi:phosphoglycolate phosphatase-like HAD superfamily hydrolase
LTNPLSHLAPPSGFEMSRKAVIFDLGGVLIDYDYVRTVNASAALLGLSPEEFSASFGRVSRSIGTGVLDSSSTYQLAQSRSRYWHHFQYQCIARPLAGGKRS